MLACAGSRSPAKALTCTYTYIMTVHRRNNTHTPHPILLLSWNHQVGHTHILPLMNPSRNCTTNTGKGSKQKWCGRCSGCRAKDCGVCNIALTKRSLGDQTDWNSAVFTRNVQTTRIWHTSNPLMQVLLYMYMYMAHQTLSLLSRRMNRQQENYYWSIYQGKP